MTDLPADRDSSGSTEERAPRWVKVFGIIGLVLVLLMLVALLTGHGPGRHMQSGHHLGGPTPPVAHTP